MSAAQIFSILYRLKFLLSEGTLSQYHPYEIRQISLFSVCVFLRFRGACGSGKNRFRHRHGQRRGRRAPAFFCCPRAGFFHNNTHMKFTKASALWVALFCASAALAAPERIVFDTDMGNDVDDALALAMLHRFKNEGKTEIAAVLVNKGAPEAPVFCALLNEYFGNGSVPVGHIADGKTPRAGAFAGKVAAAKNSDGSPQISPSRTRARREIPRRRKARAESSGGIRRRGRRLHIRRLPHERRAAARIPAGRNLPSHGRRARRKKDKILFGDGRKFRSRGARGI